MTLVTEVTLKGVLKLDLYHSFIIYALNVTLSYISEKSQELPLRLNFCDSLQAPFSFLQLKDDPKCDEQDIVSREKNYMVKSY